MLPDSDHLPARSLKRNVVSLVSLDVSLNLCPPPISIGGGQRAMIEASMPPAAVNKNGQSRTAEDDISLASKIVDRADMHPVAKSAPMEL